MNRSHQKAQTNNRLSIAGLILFLVPVTIYILWIIASSSNPSATQAENVATYLSYFPQFLRSISAISVLLVISAIGSIVLSFIGRRSANKFLRVTGLIVIIAASFLLFLQIFSLM